MTSEEFHAVREVLLRHLHETEDEELSAALWQFLESHDATVTRLVRLHKAVQILKEEL